YTYRTISLAPALSLSTLFLSRSRDPRHLHSFPTRRSSDLTRINDAIRVPRVRLIDDDGAQLGIKTSDEARDYAYGKNLDLGTVRSEEHTSELQSLTNLVCRLLLEKKKTKQQLLRHAGTHVH